jgi:hypothetical protein
LRQFPYSCLNIIPSKHWNRKDAKSAKRETAKAQRFKDAKEFLRCMGEASVAHANSVWGICVFVASFCTQNGKRIVKGAE